MISIEIVLEKLALGNILFHIFIVIPISIIPPSLHIDLPGIAFVDAEVEIVDVVEVFADSIPIQLLRSIKILVALEVSWVPIVTSYFIRDISKLLVL